MNKVQLDIKEKTVGHIVACDYRKSDVLATLGVDYSCGGNRTLSQVFIGKDEDMQNVLQEWKKIDQLPPEKEMDFLDWDMALLITYIIKLHHQFVSSQTKFMTELAYKVAESNQARNPELRTVAELFEATGKRLELKGRQEEQELFPYIMLLQDAMAKGKRLNAAAFGPVSGPIGVVKTEGEQIVAALRQFRQLTNNYIAPPYATSTCAILYKLLAGYEADTLLHLHLENNILFPRAIQTEDCLRANQQIT